MSSDFLIVNEPSDYAISAHIEALFGHCSTLGASDIFIKTGVPVFINVHGKKRKVTRRSLNRDDVISIINNSRYATNSEALMGEGNALNYAFNISMSRDALPIRLRCNALKMSGQTSFNLVARTINAIPPTSTELHIEDSILNICEMSTKGMVLFCGATGTGKSTSLAAVIRHLLEKEDGNHHFIDIGNPIEYTFDMIDSPSSIVTPISIPDSLPTFQQAIIESLRMAPTIIQVTEMRDTMTLLAGLEAAKTGHLLFSTLHTNNTILAVKRMLHMMPKEMMHTGEMDIIENTNLIVAQTLAPTVDGKRCAIREIFPLSNDTRFNLYSSKNLMKDCHDILHDLGQPMAVDIENKFKDGLISQDTRDKLNLNFSKAILDIGH